MSSADEKPDNAATVESVRNGYSPELILMGTGTSVGVPIVGCGCSVCTSGNPKNHRTRTGVLVRAPRGEFVIDAGPELRLQLLANRASMIRAAVFTHAHADHVMGMDDLRIFGFRLEKERIEAAAQLATSEGRAFDKDSFRQNMDSNIPLFCEQNVENDIRQIFHYAFSDPSSHTHRFAAPRLAFEEIGPGREFELLGLKILPVRLHHGDLPILGFRIGDVAFCTDISTIPADSREHLQGLDTLIIDALRYAPHPTHLSVSQAVKWAERLQPRRTILTHMSHELDYDQLSRELPDGIEPGYDGMKVEINVVADHSTTESR